MIHSQTTSNGQQWFIYLRPRVGDSISYLGSTWINKNGKNSEPGVGLDWELIFKPAIPIINPLKSRFILVHKSTNSDNSNIELNDFARGFGPGVGVNLEYWTLAQFLNTTTDNDTNNYLNYKPIQVTLPNS